MVNTLIICKPSNRNAQQGVTLVELLIALFIVGIAATTVVLNAPPADQNARQEAERFAARLQAASDEAIISGEPLGLAFTPQSYQFMRFRDRNWQVLDGKILGQWQLDRDISLSMEVSETAGLRANDEIISGGGSITPSLRDVERQKDNFQPLVQFRPYGEDTGLTAIFSGTSRQWAVTMTGEGRVEVRRYEGV